MLGKREKLSRINREVWGSYQQIYQWGGKYEDGSAIRKSNGLYGYHHMTIDVNRKLQKALNHNRIYRLMKLVGIQSVIYRKKKPYRVSKSQQIVENLLNRGSSATRPNEKW